MSKLAKRDWILLLLYQRPLDRIRLMKCLFLVWHRMGRNVPDFFEFSPYLYGPCSFDFYDEMQYLENEHLISSAPHQVSQWVSYYLTPKGKDRVLAVESSVDSDIISLTREIANEVGCLGFRSLLKRVYAEAPDFAVNTVMPWRTES